jgi:hypothetical protein
MPELLLVGSVVLAATVAGTEAQLPDGKHGVA